MSKVAEIDRIESVDVKPEKLSDASRKLAFTVEEITPDIAREMLEHDVSGRHGQKLSASDRKAIDTYKTFMKNRGWAINFQPIIFDEDGKLLDGFLRLTACIESETNFKTMVVRNVRADTLHTIDQHRRRTYAGVLESRGIDKAGALVRTMSKLIRIENGTLGISNEQIVWQRYEKVFDANPELVEANQLTHSSAFLGCQLQSTARNVLVFMAIKAGKRNEVVRFLRELGPNATMPYNTAPRMLSLHLASLNEARRQVSDRGMRISDDFADVDSTLGLAILAFNDFCKDISPSAPYRWERDYGDARQIQYEEDLAAWKADKAAGRTVGPRPTKDKNLIPSAQVVREHAPPNLGLPVMDGYPGLAEGKFDMSTDASTFAGRIAQEMVAAAEADSGAARISSILVTPEMARHFLQFNDGNRKLQPKHVDMMAADIQKGQWMVNAQPICFTANPFAASTDGERPRLLNGQHRLHAIIKAGEPIEVPIAINIPDEAFATFDNHAKRTVRASGAKIDVRVLASAAKLQWREDNGYPLTTNRIDEPGAPRVPSPSATDIVETQIAHPDLEKGFTRSRRKGMAELASAGVMTYFIYRIEREDPVLAEEFLNGIETGAEVPAGSPILALRNTLRGRRLEKKVARYDALRLLIDHWEAFKNWKGKSGPKTDDAQESLDLDGGA